MPGERFDRLIEAHMSDKLVATVRESSDEFEGVVGLPLLSQFEYGGDADQFWIRSPR